jgi:hypothetical protein
MVTFFSTLIEVVNETAFHVQGPHLQPFQRRFAAAAQLPGADEYQTDLQTSVLERDHHKQRTNLDVLNVFWSVQAENLAAWNSSPLLTGIEDGFDFSM